MNPRDCGTCRPPADDTPDREELDRFAEFLRAVNGRGVAAVAKDSAWRAYVRGEETS